MRIDAFAVTPVRLANTDPDWRYGDNHVPRLAGALVALRAADGTVGEGYAPVLRHLGLTPEGLASAATAMARALLGRDATALATGVAAAARAQPAALPALSAVDMALHDLAGRLLGLPLATLLGGAVRDRVPAVRIVPIKPPAAMAERARALADEGYGALKLKGSGDLAVDLARVAAVREAVGPGVALYVDPNQAYAPKAARALCAGLADLGVTRIEQPVPAADLRGLAAVAAGTGLVVEADEAMHTEADVVAIRDAAAADAVCLKLTKSGGLAATMAIARLAGALGLGCRMGTAFGGALISMAAAQAAAALPTAEGCAEIAEFAHFDGDPHEPPRIEDGSLVLSDAPGIGVTRRDPAGWAWQTAG